MAAPVEDPEINIVKLKIQMHTNKDTVDVLTADMGLPGQLRMKETKRTPLFNGAIECRLFRFEIRKNPQVKATDQTPVPEE